MFLKKSRNSDTKNEEKTHGITFISKYPYLHFGSIKIVDSQQELNPHNRKQ